MALAYVALGSNIEPEANLPAAVSLMAENLDITGRSRVYRTPPWGYAEQADFLNAVVAVETFLPPEPLLAALLGIEQTLRRERTIPNGPRTIDLDLLLYDQVVMETPRLTLPHPRLHQRAFVLAPLCDLLPEGTHPLLGQTFAALLEALPPEEKAGIEPVELVLRG